MNHGWQLVYDEKDADSEGVREALCTLGNGYFATRGAACESTDDGVHYPGTYLAGGYNRLVTEMAGQLVENEDLVNLPNWSSLSWRIDSLGWFGIADVDVLAYRQSLDLRRGVLERSIRTRDSEGRITRISQQRIVHMRFPHIAVQTMEIEAENWSGSIEVRSALDGRLTNSGVARYRELASRHLEPLREEDDGDDTLLLVVRTNQSRIEIAQAARTRLYFGRDRVAVVPRTVREAGYVAQDFEASLLPAAPLRIEKVVALYTSRDRTLSEAALESRTAVARAGDFATLVRSHEQAWRHLWRRFDVEIRRRDAQRGERTQMTLRLHVFHLLQTASLNTRDLDVGVPARGWHGEAYRGHIFWDELFIFPLLNLRLPEVTRGLLMYRCRRLPEAREIARAQGARGALFPWQSGSNGREESQRLHLNPESGRWIEDHTWLQQHINAAVAFNIWSYYQVTGDLEFLSFFGAEVLLEIARFWASVATWNAERERYEIHGVVGPDEFHTALPGADRPGLSNQAYTNVMAVWVLCRALDVLDLLPQERRDELCEQLELDVDELHRWDEVSRRMRIVFHDGVISQFEGYEGLDELDWDGYRERYGDIHRLDRILEAEGDSANGYKASKQADVLMLFYLFSADELKAIFDRLGYPFDGETIPRNVDYYSCRTTHGSTLSRIVSAWVTARSDRIRSWRLFEEALESDISDVQGGTTAEGIHLGAMAGTVDLLHCAYLGISARDNRLWLDPCLPEEIESVRMTVRYRGNALDIEVSQGTLTVRARSSNEKSLALCIDGDHCDLGVGETRWFELESGASGGH